MDIANCSSNPYCPILGFFSTWRPSVRPARSHPAAADLNEIFDGSTLLLTGSLRASGWYTGITDGVIARSYIIFLSMACSRKITFAHGQHTLEGGRARKEGSGKGKRGEERRGSLAATCWLLQRRQSASGSPSSIFLRWISHSHSNNVVTCINNLVFLCFCLRLRSLYSFTGPLIPAAA